MAQKPTGWIDAGKLFAGTPKSTLAEWRNVGILPEPKSISLGRGKGSASYCPPGTDALFARLREPGRAIQDRDVLIWDLWFDPADYPVNIRRWILERFDKFLTVLRVPETPAIVAALRNPETATAAISTLPRRHPMRAILGNLKDASALATLCSWALDIAADRDPAEGLYDPQSSVLAALLKSFGLTSNFAPAPDKPINPEMLSLAYLSELAEQARAGTADADDERFSKVRSDCRAIEALAHAAAAVDWNAVSRALDKDAAFLALTSIEPPSYRTRREERHARRKNQWQPKIIRTLLAIWNNYDLRAFLVSVLSYIHCSPEHAKNLAEILALSHLALMQFPRRAGVAEPGR